jgi:hypothetical protein
MHEFKVEYKNVDTESSYRDVYKSPFLGADDFDDDKDTIVTLERAFIAEGTFDKGRKDTVVFGRFKGYDKDIVINKTNSKMIEKFTGEEVPGKWKNVLIQIYVDPTVKKSGETVGGWRIRPKQPKAQLPDLTPSHPKWADVVGKVASKTTDVDTIRQHFNVSKETETRLLAEVEQLSTTGEVA